MKYEIRVDVNLRPMDNHVSQGVLCLSETQSVELTTLSDAATVLVKLHEFFVELKTKGVGR